MFYLVFELTEKSVQIVRFSLILFYFNFNYMLLQNFHAPVKSNLILHD